MARPKKVQKVKEPVRIRQRKLANGNMSLYLDVYVKGVRKVESLGLYIVPESTPIDRQQNNHARQVAEKIKAERILALQNHGVRQWDKVKRSCITLVDFLKEYEQEKFGFSTSTLKGRRDLRLKIETYLKEANCPDIVLANVDVDFCRGFIDFLRYAKNAVRRDGSVISNGAAHHHQAVLNGALNKAVRDGSMEAAVAQVKGAQARAVARSFKDPDNYENLQFFYHPDHLGSSSFITNLEGEVVQHIEYVPFGEVFIEERNNVWNTPYLFNAKEFDEETGMYYYGARYYNPQLSVWISVDPLYEVDLSTSPYVFCGNNPIIRVDSDGKIWDTVWDVGNLVYDVGAAIYHHVKGDHKTAKGHWVDAGFDAAATLIPFVPAGASKVVSGGTKVAKGLDKASDTRKGLKNAGAISDGRKFEADELKRAVDGGKNVSSQTRLVPQNGKGNVKGNRTNTDQLIKNDDGTFSIVETKRSSTTPLSKGQKAAQKHVDNGNGILKFVQIDLSKDSLKEIKIRVKEYHRVNKIE